MPGRTKRTKKNRILETETAQRAQPDSGKFLKMIEEIAKREGKTVEDELNEGRVAITPNDVIWIGGRDANKPGKSEELDRLLTSELSDRKPLERIALAVINAYPDVSSFSGIPLKGKSLREFRLQNAMHYLTGDSLSRGRPPKHDYEEVCTEAAQRYFVQTIQGLTDGGDTSLGQILRDILVPEALDLDHKTIEDHIEPYRRYFQKHKDRLLTKVSSRGLPERDERRAKYDDAIRALRSLGISINDLDPEED